jgi:hypothetical protein
MFIVRYMLLSLSSYYNSLPEIPGTPVHRAATFTLWKISSRSETGAMSVVQGLSGLLQCTDNIQAIIAACEVLRKIASEAGVIEAHPCLHLASLIG